MAHMIEGNKAFYLSKPAWHGLGTVLTQAPTIAEAWRLAYPHSIFELPLKADFEGLTTDIESHKAIVRDDGQVLGVVGSKYELIQPVEAFEFFSPWLESGQVELEAGGSLCNGSRMWALAKIKDAINEIAKNDPVTAYFLVYTSFDGSLSHGLQFTPIRVVCQNTLAEARQGATKSNSKGVRHTKGMHAKIDQIQASIDVARQTFDATCQQYELLAKKSISKAQTEAFVRYVIEPEGNDSAENSTKLENKVQSVLSLVSNQRNAELVPAIRGTAWEAYNAVTEYITHEHGRNDDNRLNAQWFGDSAKLNRRAFDAALCLAQ